MCMKSSVKPSFEKLMPAAGESFRCLNRNSLRAPAKWHRHPEAELTYVEKGSGFRLVGDHIGSYRDGDLVLLGSDIPHTWSSDEYRGKTYDLHPAFVVQFHPGFLGKDFLAAAEMEAVASLLERARRGIWYPRPVADDVGKRIKTMLKLSGVPRLIELLACLHELTQVDSGQLLSSELYLRTAGPEGERRIQTVCDHILHHLSDPELDLKTLADLVRMNPSAFSRFFRQSTGRTVTTHIAELRIGLACRLLTETDRSILSISLEAGFSNLSNFNRRFRSLRGMTPREYRSHFQAVR